VHFHNSCVWKQSFLQWSSDAFFKFSVYKVCKKCSGCIFTIYASKNKAFSCWVQTSFVSHPLTRLTKKFWAHFHDLCIHIWRCLLWRSDAFCKFFTCNFCKKRSRHIFTMYASKNEAVCYEVQTHFGSYPLTRFTKKVLGAYSLFMCLKTKLLAVKFRRILEVLRSQGFQKKFWAHFHNFASKNEAVCCVVQMHFGCSLMQDL